MAEISLTPLSENKEEADKQIIEISTNNNYTTSISLDYESYSKRYKLMTIDLSKHIKLQDSD